MITSESVGNINMKMLANRGTVVMASSIAVLLSRIEHWPKLVNNAVYNYKNQIQFSYLIVVTGQK